MTAISRIHANKTPIRIHYIAEWAGKLGIKRAEIIEKTGADKSLVSRWFSGTLPTERYLVQIAAIFWEDPEDQDVGRLFRDPEDDWIARWFKRRNRRPDQIQEVLKLMLLLDNEPRRPEFVRQHEDSEALQKEGTKHQPSPRTERRAARR